MEEAHCTTHDQLAAEAEALRAWFEENLEQQWQPVAYSNADVVLQELPSIGTVHRTRCRVHCRCSYESMFNFNYNATTDDLRAYDKSMLTYAVFDRVPDTEIVVTETSFSVMWPVAPRAFVSVHDNYPTEHGHAFVQGSIVNDKAVPSSKCVVAYKRSGLLIERDPEDPARCYIERVIMMDPRGSIPAFVANKYKTNDAERLQELDAYVVKLEQSGKIKDFAK